MDGICGLGIIIQDKRTLSPDHINTYIFEIHLLSLRLDNYFVNQSGSKVSKKTQY